MVDVDRVVEMVIVDDDEALLNALVVVWGKRKVIDTYSDPMIFLGNVMKYLRNTKICIDYNLHSQFTGIEIAEQLRDSGYTNLYLMTGSESLDPEDIPEYLTRVSKNDIDALSALGD